MKTAAGRFTGIAHTHMSHRRRDRLSLGDTLLYDCACTLFSVPFSLLLDFHRLHCSFSTFLLPVPRFQSYMFRFPPITLSVFLYPFVVFLVSSAFALSDFLFRSFDLSDKLHPLFFGSSDSQCLPYVSRNIRY